MTNPLRMWTPQPDGTWAGNVEYSTGPAQNQLGTFPGDQIVRLPD